MAEERFLHRWARRKHEAARATPAAPEPPPSAQAPVAAPPAPVAEAPVEPPSVEPPPLPPVESLSLESDFKPFLSAKVEETVKRAALRKLFSDPHFNVMDGLDIYIDDYSKPDPMPEGFLDKLADVYKTLEEKVAEAAPSETTTEPPATPDEPSTKAEKDSDERQG
jgi:hypothetical protein